MQGVAVLDVPQSKVSQFIALGSLATGTDLPKEVIDQIAAVPEVDITEICDKDSRCRQIPLMLCLAAAGAIVEKVNQ